MSTKITLGIIFGGRSVEHEVSILSGSQALNAADSSKYNVQPVYIARDNVWYIGEELNDISFFQRKNPSISQLTRVYPCPDAMRGKLRLIGSDTGGLFKKPVNINLDCVLPVTHGTFVEDGSLQGLLDMAGVPYAGSNVRGSMVGMDKLLFKAVMRENSIPVVDYLQLHKSEWGKDEDRITARILSELSGDVIVKPAIAGSSVGIGRASDSPRLQDVINFAFKFSDRVLVEKAISNMTEINCSVIDGDPPIPSILEQPLSHSELLTFDEKYKGNTKGTKGVKGTQGSKGMAAQQRKIPAPVSEDVASRIREYAVKTFQIVGAGGVARIDFILDSGGDIFVNELNNIPGSLSFYLWEHMGKSFTDLIDKMVERSFEVHKIRNRTTYAFESNLLAER